MSKSLEIRGRRIGPGEPLFVIAEIGLNHQGSIDRALALVDAAAAAGADAVKLQTLRAEALVAPQCPAPPHVRARSLREFFSRFELDEAGHRQIAARARERGLILMATPFDQRSVDLLDRIGVDAYKIASGDLTYDGLISLCAGRRKPLVISTGMAELHEIAHAVGRARMAGADRIALLHCVSRYPVPEGEENLRAIATLARQFELPVGLSDHGRDTFAAPIAVSLGATIYERHLVLHHDDGSIDAAVSSTPGELAVAIETAARAARALGHGEKVCMPAECGGRIPSRRGLYASRDLRAGEVVHAADIAALRPAHAVGPQHAADLAGVTLTRAIAAGEPFIEEDLPVSRSRGLREVA